MIYLDYAATSFKKPQQVYQAMQNALYNNSANPGRGGHAPSQNAARLVYNARESLCRLFGIDSPERIAFFCNTTAALNAAIKGVLRFGDHAIISSMDHNSVLRPIAELKRRGIIDYTIIPADAGGRLSPKDFAKAFRPNTRLVVCTHASNVCGNVYDISAIGSLAKQFGAYFLVDAAQSAGVIPVDIHSVDMVAFPGHKGLYGPQGSAGLYVRDGLILETITEGGTGSQSSLIYQPEEMPDRLESGTLNVPAIAGLGAAAEFIYKEGMNTIFEHESMLTKYFEEKVKNIAGITIYGSEYKAGITALNILKKDCVEVADELNQYYGIAVRSGLHCAPLAHEALATQGGCVRFSFGYFTKKTELDQALFALHQIAEKSV